MDLTPLNEDLDRIQDDVDFWSVDYPRHELPLNLHTIYFELDGDDLDPNDNTVYPTIEHPADCSTETGCWYAEIYPEEIEPSIPEGTKLDGTQYLMIAEVEKIPVHQSYLGFEYGETLVTILAEIEP